MKWRDTLEPIDAYLLDDLSKMRFCSVDRALFANPPTDCDAFTRAVFVGEGMAVPDWREHEYQRVRAVVAKVFARVNDRQ